MLRRSLACALVALTAAGCAASFDSGSKLKSLRVLAVKKDKPYARPGETVHLNMLLDDPRTFLPDAGQATGKHFTVGWLSGCENPSAGSFSDCIDKLKGGDAGAPLGGAINTLDFSVTLSDHIIPKPDPKHPPPNPNQPPNGTALVFFAVCAGNLQPMSGELGFGCVSPIDGKTLGADDFVIGYTQIFAYEGYRNANPFLDFGNANPDAKNNENELKLTTGFQVDGHVVPVDCIGDDCVKLESKEFGVGLSPMRVTSDGGLGADGGRASDAGFADAGNDAGAGISGAAGAGASDAGASDLGPLIHAGPPTCSGADQWRCFPQCTQGDQNKCDKHSVKLIVTKASAEVDSVAEKLEGQDVLEQMWVNYYTDAGKLEHEVKLLNDATTGWNENHAADLRTPQTLGTFHVWAAAHDNRGGVEWARATLTTTNPY
jgi:hypothetical protein